MPPLARPRPTSTSITVSVAPGTDVSYQKISQDRYLPPIRKVGVSSCDVDPSLVSTLNVKTIPH